MLQRLQMGVQGGLAAGERPFGSTMWCCAIISIARQPCDDCASPSLAASMWPYAGCVCRRRILRLWSSRTHARLRRAAQL